MVEMTVEEFEELESWKRAVIEALIISWAYRPEHETNPRMAMHDFAVAEAQYALDPRISPDARELERRGYERGLAETGKALRKVLKDKALTDSTQ